LEAGVTDFLTEDFDRSMMILDDLTGKSHLKANAFILRGEESAAHAPPAPYYINHNLHLLIRQQSLARRVILTSIL
jgi:hypothetical protein